ncbi:DUF6193 family natural product biosynthesis protein [Streptomyces sp. NPDC050085]|uniref:DUF6193 family natural product biosynthesis protein n=1 Tax=Streptomyces sp. NPDC050085 TaxID=3365600 RepID=UPI0037BAD5E2
MEAETSGDVSGWWQDLLDQHRPPHADHYTASMWELLQAASHDPLLSTLYPTISTTMLTFSCTNDFNARDDERFPVIGAAEHQFGVSVLPISEDNIRLVTADPTEAVELAVRLLRERLDALNSNSAAPLDEQPSTNTSPSTGTTEAS